MSLSSEQALFEIWVWKVNNSGSFTSMLYDLFCKADEFNKHKLAFVFPQEYQAWVQWQNSENEDEFLRQCHAGFKK